MVMNNCLHKERGDNLNFFLQELFLHIHIFFTEHYTLEVAGSQSWSNYYRAKEQKKGQVCLTRHCLHFLPSRWRGLESPLLPPLNLHISEAKHECRPLTLIFMAI